MTAANASKGRYLIGLFIALSIPGVYRSAYSYAIIPRHGWKKYFKKLENTLDDFLK
jgi:hypothetical protein